MRDSSHLFCACCSEQLDLIEAGERCDYCFAEIGRGGKGVCLKCRKQASPFKRVASAFDYLGPAATLIKRLKYGNQPYLSSGAAAFMVAQFVRLNWPIPDLLVPVPMPYLKRMWRGYNQSLLLAEEMGKLLARPALELLRRDHGDYSQAGLTLTQREQFSGSTIHLRQGHSIADKTLLLVDDVMTSGSTLRRCAEVLQAECPKEIYALTFCRATRDSIKGLTVEKLGVAI